MSHHVSHEVLFLPELLSSVFEHLHALHASSSHSVPFPIYPGALPFQLERVCKLWRTVAHTTPRLYSTFSLRIDGENYELPILDLYLKRSGGLPLHTYLEYEPIEGEKEIDINPYLDLLLPHAQRWRNVTFKLPGDVVYKLTSTTLLTLTCPSLKSLSLYETSATTVPVPDSYAAPSPVGSYPALISLTLSRFSPSPLLPLIIALLNVLPTAQVTNLTIIPHYARAMSQLSASDALHILRMFPSLKRLSFAVSDMTGHSLSLPNIVREDKDVTLEHLSHLTLTGHPSAIAGLFEGLTVPNLRWVQSRYPANETEDSAFNRCLERSGRAVKEPEYDENGEDLYSWGGGSMGGWARGTGSDGTVEIVSASD